MSWVFPSRLEHPRAILVEADVAHAPQLVDGLPASTFDFFLSSAPEPMDANGMRVYIERYYLVAAVRPYVVIDPQSSVPVGMTSYLDINEADRRLEIGMTWYKPSAQGTTVNPAAKLLLLEHAFETLECERVQLKTDGRNLRSQAAISKLGAVREGVLRKYGRQPSGYVRDAVMFSIIRSEWPAVKAGLLERVA